MSLHEDRDEWLAGRLRAALPDASADAATLPARADRRSRRRAAAAVGLAIVLPLVVASVAFAGWGGGESRIALAPGPAPVPVPVPAPETATAVVGADETATTSAVPTAAPVPPSDPGQDGLDALVAVPREPLQVEGVVASVTHMDADRGVALAVDDGTTLEVRPSTTVVDVDGKRVSPDALDGHLIRAWTEDGLPNDGRAPARFVLDAGDPPSGICQDEPAPGGFVVSPSEQAAVDYPSCPPEQWRTRMLDAGLREAAWFRVYLPVTTTGGRGTSSYQVPAGQRVAITDYVLESRGDTGELRLTVPAMPVANYRLESFRTIDLHYVEPLIVDGEAQIVLDVSCENATSAPCSTGVLVTGLIGTPAAEPGAFGRSSGSSSLPQVRPAEAG